jgi:hypothetical protein
MSFSDSTDSKVTYDPESMLALCILWFFVDGETRGHSLKLTKNRSRLDIGKYYFTNRVVEDWNNLPETVITAKNVKIFEKRLDKLWQNHPMMYRGTTIHITINRQQPEEDS